MAWSVFVTCTTYGGCCRSAARVVVVGGGFLGLEAADALVKQGHDVTLVHSRGHLLNQQLDESAGHRLQQDLEARGLKFVMQARTQSIEASL